MPYQTFLADVKKLIVKQKITFPKIFISYAWEGDATATGWLHNRLIRFRDDLNALGMNDFTEAGKEVFLDVSEMTGNLERTMRENLDKSQVVLAICTPNFGERVTQKTNVAFEYNLTLDRLAQKTIDVYPLWLAGTFKESVPEKLQVLNSRDCRDAWQHEIYFAHIDKDSMGLLPTLLGWTRETLPYEYTTLWQKILKTAFSEQGVPNLIQKLKKSLPSNNVSIEQEAFLRVKNSQQAAADLPQWFKQWSIAIRYRYPKSQAQWPVTVILEQQSECRESYWSALLHDQWEPLNQQGILPIYIPLHHLPVQSDDIVGDWLKLQGLKALDIERIQQHYAVLLILSGYEVRVHAKRQNLLVNSHWQQWHGHTLILCDENERQACRFLDEYLQSLSLLAMEAFKIVYPKSEIKLAPLRSIQGWGKRQMSVQSESVPFTLTEDQITLMWQQFLEKIKIINPSNKTFFFSQGEQSELSSRLTVLKSSLIRLGFQLSDKIETADNILVLCSPDYLKSITQETQSEYAFIKNVLQDPQKAVYPLWFTGDNFGSSVPSELFKLLVRDCRDASEDYINWGNLDNPLGLMPAMLNIRFGTPPGDVYQRHWQHFCKTGWGEQAHPSSLLFKLKVASRKMASQETLYQSTKAYYQSPQITLVKDGEPSGSVDALFNELLEKAQANAQHTTHLLFAEPGSGKSMSLLKLEEGLWEQFHRYHLIPIRIPLNQIKPEQNDFISVWLKERANYSTSEVRILQKQYRFLVLLDGYDEFVFEHGEHDVVQLANLNQWQGLSILSCRTQMDDKAGRMRNEGRCYLCPFTTEQIDVYLLAQAKNNPALTPELRQKVHVLPGLIQLIKNPLMLYITSDILPDLAQADTNVPMTRYSLYERFTHKWFQREFVRVIQQGLLAIGGLTQQQWEFGLLYFAEQIAVIMFREEKLQIPQTRLDAQAQALLTQMLVQHSSQLEIAALRNACPLKVIGTGFQFIHKSFQEFLVAQTLLKALPLSPSPYRAVARSAQADADYFHAQLPTLDTNLWNQLELRKEPAVLDFLSDTKPNYYRLLEVTCESKGKLHNNEYRGNFKVAQAAGNAMTLFSYCGYSAAGLNLENIQIQNADLSGSLLMKANLQHSNFNNVIAVDAQWARANFQNAKLNVNFGEYAHVTGDSWVHSLISHPDDLDLIIAGYENNEIIVWNYYTQKRIKILRGHSNFVSCLAINDEGILFSGSCDKTIKSWDIKGGICLKTFLGHKNKINCLVVNAGSLFSGCDGGIIKQWDINTGRCLKTLSCISAVNCLVINGESLFFGENKIIKQWDINTGKCIRIFDGHMHFLTCFSFIGRTLLSGSWDRTIKQWDINTGKCIKTFEHGSNVDCLAVSGERLFSAGDNIVKQWDINTGKCLRILGGHTNSVYCLAINSKILFSGSWDRTIKLWNIEHETCLKIFRPHISRGISILLEGRNLFSMGKADRDPIKQWDINMEKCIKMFDHEDEIYRIVVSGETLFSAGYNAVKQWDINTGECIKTFNHSYYNTFHSTPCLVISENRMFAAGNKIIEQWDINTGQRLKIFEQGEEVRCLTISEDTLFSGGNRMIKQWDIKTGKCLKILREHTDRIICLTISGGILFSSSKDETIRQWSINIGKCQFTFRDHRSDIFNIFVHPLKPEWVISMSRDSGLLLVRESFTGKVLACEQWYPCDSVAINWEEGQLLLGLSNGAAVLAEVPVSQYWDKSLPLPPWQIKWMRGGNTLDVQDMQLRNTQINDVQTLTLLQQRGAVVKITDSQISTSSSTILPLGQPPAIPMSASANSIVRSVDNPFPSVLNPQQNLESRASSTELPNSFALTDIHSKATPPTRKSLPPVLPKAPSSLIHAQTRSIETITLLPKGFSRPSSKTVSSSKGETSSKLFPSVLPKGANK